ncbi:MAG: hypothetical protein M0R66_08275 [Candidatus Omnitrophica bacterium]|nr:hypothetical protein [Candidatus Omnitrophota bacterium]
MNNKEEFYNWVRLTGFATLIPFVLLSGPIGGYLVGLFLAEKFHLSRNAVLICLAIGSLASFLQTIKIIRTMLKLDKKSK